ncbi:MULTISPECIES: LysE family translocator [unclassified Limnohabitans]|uniref:LysE family translocator n=1 Tax=unclassified Limnohabitans TaxID=2626134 RepID=UPI0006DC1948|nr:MULTISPECIES: LysE family translocator [unclassified Limnohabitans]ALK90472.1 Cysteine/O-acetylserine efflux protein [Limnohabitans sp. 103DPR2]PUE31691.1 lysine transporter LysE [Limnohabitans sp. Hippo4]
MNFILSSEELTALLILSTAASFTPGPNTTLSTALAANQGLRSAMRFILAVPVGWGLLLSLCMAGLGHLVLAIPALRWVIIISGTLYLLWMAYRLWGTRELSNANEARLTITFFQGVGVQFLNIKAWMLALSIVAGWVAGKEDALGRSLVLLPIMMGFGLVSNLTYAVMGSLLRQWLAQGIRLLVFNRCMAAALVFTAIWMFKTSL